MFQQRVAFLYHQSSQRMASHHTEETGNPEIGRGDFVAEGHRIGEWKLGVWSPINM